MAHLSVNLEQSILVPSTDGHVHVQTESKAVLHSYVYICSRTCPFWAAIPKGVHFVYPIAEQWDLACSTLVGRQLPCAIPYMYYTAGVILE